MATVLTLTDSARNERQNNFRQSRLAVASAKAKEKQRHPQANAGCFTFAFAQPHKKLPLN